MSQGKPPENSNAGINIPITVDLKTTCFKSVSVVNNGL